MSRKEMTLAEIDDIEFYVKECSHCGSLGAKYSMQPGPDGMAFGPATCLSCNKPIEIHQRECAP